MDLKISYKSFSDHKSYNCQHSHSVGATGLISDISQYCLRTPGQSLDYSSTLHCSDQQCSHLSWTLGHNDISLLQSLNLRSSSSLATTDDGSGVTHSSARWSCHSSNEGNNRLGIGARVVFNQVVSSPLLSLATNLTNHDNSLGVGVVDEQLETVNEVGSIERISSNTNTESLTQTHSTGLVDCLVCECS